MLGISLRRRFSLVTKLHKRRCWIRAFERFARIVLDMLLLIFVCVSHFVQYIVFYWNVIIERIKLCINCRVHVLWYVYYCNRMIMRIICVKFVKSPEIIRLFKGLVYICSVFHYTDSRTAKFYSWSCLLNQPVEK